MEQYILGLLGAALLGWLFGMFLRTLVELCQMIKRDVRKLRKKAPVKGPSL